MKFLEDYPWERNPANIPKKEEIELQEFCSPLPCLHPGPLWAFMALINATAAILSEGKEIQAPSWIFSQDGMMEEGG